MQYAYSSSTMHNTSSYAYQLEQYQSSKFMTGMHSTSYGLKSTITTRVEQYSMHSLASMDTTVCILQQYAQQYYLFVLEYSRVLQQSMHTVLTTIVATSQQQYYSVTRVCILVRSTTTTRLASSMHTLASRVTRLSTRVRSYDVLEQDYLSETQLHIVICTLCRLELHPTAHADKRKDTVPLTFVAGRTERMKLLAATSALFVASHGVSKK